eukprot:GHVQ01029482.1.p1 GENE.GHVQ01029482.1~~GHVQ01029482.1.p1  ORF type:complete len:905 (+),score=143.53 GHVQ01029482.1:225-2939(+)
MPFSCKYLGQTLYRPAHHKTLVSNVYSAALQQLPKTLPHESPVGAAFENRSIDKQKGGDVASFRELAGLQDLEQLMRFCELRPDKNSDVVEYLSRCIRYDYEKLQYERVKCGAVTMTRLAERSTADPRLTESPTMRTVMLLLSSELVHFQVLGMRLLVVQLETSDPTDSTITQDDQITYLVKLALSLCQEAMRKGSNRRYLEISVPSAHLMYLAQRGNPETFWRMTAELTKFYIRNIGVFLDCYDCAVKELDESSPSALLNWTARCVGISLSQCAMSYEVLNDMVQYTKLFALRHWQPAVAAADFFRSVAKVQQPRTRANIVAKFIALSTETAMSSPSAAAIVLDIAGLMLEDTGHSCRARLRQDIVECVPKVMRLVHVPGTHNIDNTRKPLRKAVFKFLKMYCFQLEYSCYVMELQAAMSFHCHTCLEDFTEFARHKSASGSNHGTGSWTAVRDALEGTRPLIDENKSELGNILSSTFLPLELLKLTPVDLSTTDTSSSQRSDEYNNDSEDQGNVRGPPPPPSDVMQRAQAAAPTAVHRYPSSELQQTGGSQTTSSMTSSISVSSFVGQQSSSYHRCPPTGVSVSSAKSVRMNALSSSWPYESDEEEEADEQQNELMELYDEDEEDARSSVISGEALEDRDAELGGDSEVESPELIPEARSVSVKIQENPTMMQGRSVTQLFDDDLVDKPPRVEHKKSVHVLQPTPVAVGQEDDKEVVNVSSSEPVDDRSETEGPPPQQDQTRRTYMDDDDDQGSAADSGTQASSTTPRVQRDDRGSSQPAVADGPSAETTSSIIIGGAQQQEDNENHVGDCTGAPVDTTGNRMRAEDGIITEGRERPQQRETQDKERTGGRSISLQPGSNNRLEQPRSQSVETVDSRSESDVTAAVEHEKKKKKKKNTRGYP